MEKGKTNNPNGRPKGISNKISTTLRDILADSMKNHIENLPNLIDEIENAKDKVDAISKILPYVLPKLNTLTIKDDTEKEPMNPPTVKYERKDMSGGHSPTDDKAV